VLHILLRPPPAFTTLDDHHDYDDHNHDGHFLPYLIHLHHLRHPLGHLDRHF
jgi:hypothetical protein